MPRMVLPIASVVVVAGFFLALGYVFIVAGEVGTIVLGLGIIVAVLVVAGLRALEGYLNRGGQILGGRVSLPQGVMPFWLPTLGRHRGCGHVPWAGRPLHPGRRELYHPPRTHRHHRRARRGRVPRPHRRRRHALADAHVRRHHDAVARGRELPLRGRDFQRQDAGALLLAHRQRLRGDAGAAHRLPAPARTSSARASTACSATGRWACRRRPASRRCSSA